MPTPATLPFAPEQIEQYRRDGYLIVPGLLTDEEIDRFVAYEAQPKPDGWRQNLRHHVDDRQWNYLARHPHIAGHVAPLLGGAPMIVQTMYLEKKPVGDTRLGGQGVALHQDVHYLPCQPETLMACWVAMSDTDPENGGPCVVSGSNHHGRYRTHKTPTRTSTTPGKSNTSCGTGQAKNGPNACTRSKSTGSVARMWLS